MAKDVLVMIRLLVTAKFGSARSLCGLLRVGYALYASAIQKSPGTQYGAGQHSPL